MAGDGAAATTIAVGGNWVPFGGRWGQRSAGSAHWCHMCGVACWGKLADRAPGRVAGGERAREERHTHTHTHRTQLKAAKRGKRDSADCYRCLVRFRKTNCPWNERGVGGAPADRFAGANRRERHTWRRGSGRDGKERGERGEREMQRRENDRTTPFAQEDPSRNTRRETRKGDKDTNVVRCVEYARGSFSLCDTRGVSDGHRNDQFRKRGPKEQHTQHTNTQGTQRRQDG